METTDDATDKLRTDTPSRFGALRSQYKKSQRFQKKPNLQQSGNDQNRGRTMERSPSNQRRRCRGCGRTSHGNGKPLAREECPAIGKTCDECGLKNHFRKVCSRRRTRVSFARMEDDSSSSEDSETDYPQTDDEEALSNANDAEMTSAVHSAAHVEGFRSVFSRRRWRVL